MQKLLNWIDDRFPLTALWESQWGKYVAPKNFNFWYYFGSLAAFVLVMQIVTGIFLTMNYKPDAARAFESVEYIMRDVPWGWLIRYMHSTGASMFFVVVYLHMFRGLMYGSYRKPRELTWIFGCLIYLCLMAEAFFGYLLPWGQMSYWGAQVIVNLFSAVPVIGEDLGIWIRGDYTISDITLNRFFAFHVVAVPLVLIGLVAAHLMALHETGSNNPDGIEIKKQPKDPQTGPAARRDQLAPVLLGEGHRRRRRVPALSSRSIMFFVPDMGGYFLEANNFIPADPLKTPSTSRRCGTSRRSTRCCARCPSFLGSQFWGVLVMGAAVMIFFALPWLDRGAGQVDPLPRHARTSRGCAVFVVELPDPGLPRRRPGDGLGPVPRRLAAARRRRQGDGRLARAHRRLLPVLPPDALVHGARQDQARSGKGDRMMNIHAHRDPRRAAPRHGRRRRPAAAAGGADIRMEPAPVNRLDVASLQRGARTFVNYCLNCHSAKYMRYNRLTDLGLDAGDDPRQPDVRDRQDRRHDDGRDDADRRQGVVRRAAARPVGRGPRARQRLAVQLLPRLLPGRRLGQRLEQHGVPERRACRTCCAELSGVNRLVRTEYKDHEEATAAAIAAKGLVHARARQEPQVRRRDARRRRARHDEPGRVPADGRRPRQFPGLHGRADQEQAASASASSCCSTSACCSCSRTG